MSVENWLEALPKVALNLQFEGAFEKDTLLLVAEQNDVPANTKRWRDWADLVQNPDYNRLEELTRAFAAWVRYPEDLTRLVYDMGIVLHKQNVRYAEISILPAIYTDAGMSFEAFLDAINDGSDRLQRGWGLQLAWLLGMSRERPRKAEDIARWATSAAARKGHVVGVSLLGKESDQPSPPFKKAFTIAEKKNLVRASHAGSYGGAEATREVVENLAPDRLNDAWGLLEDAELVELLAISQMPLFVSPTRELRLKRIPNYESYPLRAMLDAGLNVIIDPSMPVLTGTSLVDEYVAAVEFCGLKPDEVEQMLLNAVDASMLPLDVKADMIEDFNALYGQFRRELLETG